MPGNIIGERRSDNERTPSRIAGGANGSHWAPEVIGVFRIPGTDGGIGHGDVQEREQTSVLLDRIASGRADHLRDAVPVPRGVSVPAPSAQNRAIKLCSGVRVEPTCAPSAFTSSKSPTYFALPRAGGPGGRNEWLAGMANGVTKPHCGNK